MTQKRKYDESLHESWNEEIGHHGTFQEGRIHTTLVTNQTYDAHPTGGVKSSTHQDGIGCGGGGGGGGGEYIMCESSSEIVDDPADDPVTPHTNNTTTTTTTTSTKPIKKFNVDEVMRNISISCEWNMCNSVFVKPEHFIAHITDHLLAITGPVSSDGYLCYWRECDFACNSKDEMDRHVYFHGFHGKIKSIGALLMKQRDKKCILDSSGRNMIPEIPECFQCMWEDCSVRFASANDFYCHTLSHVLNTEELKELKKPFLCSWNGCTSSFSIRARLRDHVRSHTQEKVVGCPNCGGIFASNTKFFDHCIRQTPLEAQQYQCSHCSRRYATERLLRDHVRHHVNHYKCPECDMTVTSNTALMAHVRYRHRKDKPHKCMQCGQGFTILTDVTRHLSVHSAEPAYSCPFEECSHKFRSVSALNRHIKLVHNGLQKSHYACHVCDSKFTLAYSLTKHLIKTHNFEWPVGHIRFRYKQDQDGFYRLQTVRYESIELNQEMMNDGEELEDIDSPYASTLLSSPASHTSQLTHITLQGNVNTDDGNNLDTR